MSKIEGFNASMAPEAMDAIAFLAVNLAHTSKVLADYVKENEELKAHIKHMNALADQDKEIINRLKKQKKG